MRLRFAPNSINSVVVVKVRRFPFAEFTHSSIYLHTEPDKLCVNSILKTNNKQIEETLFRRKK